MWDIYEHRKATRQLDALPLDVLKRYEKWKDVVAFSGPLGLRRIKGFRDEALAGNWKGHRSSRLNKQYRVIYKIEANLVKVLVMSVTPHDYRRSK
ncbi:type II toxin-antitoxin system mRNA interferase toxin, RelE/StbE family [Nitrospina watsonii]|uniref:Addiction module RelE/StbE family toxin n=1 Tax=Nitrospina watsonii TaxID=1323948 RepID=A0ABM9H9Q5_9BACT|nr:type II toxin-antitoxin system mRNA interferase toxin, RelE/StbE family [Nitrospina watsonii]CAI2716866.1 Addiction module RelE/StbE family toxin [Nitrospina watsonii]